MRNTETLVTVGTIINLEHRVRCLERLSYRMMEELASKPIFSSLIEEYVLDMKNHLGTDLSDEEISDNFYRKVK